jgi:lysozyme
MSGYEVHGIDISHYQSFVNWDTVATQGVRFAFMKATEGHEFVDTMFCHNWEATQQVGIKRGAYHFFRPTLNARTQALNFRKSVTLQVGDLPPVLDVEVVDGATKTEVIVGVKTWLDMTEIHYGIRPIIYTNLKFYNKYLVGHFDEYPMWIARYNNYAQPKLAAGKKWDFWQYGNRGRLRGIDGDVDFNVFRGSILELEEMTVPERTVWAR